MNKEKGHQRARMFCSISGKPPRVPVVSPNSKCVFEKSLLEQYIRDTGKDPITNDALAVEQVITISQSPQQVSMTNTLNSATLNSNYSIPNLLSTLQNEWDAVMLENFKLRRQLDQLTKELSTALFERDAAKLVASKLLEEKNNMANDMDNVISFYVQNSNNNEKEEDASLKKTLLAQSQEFITKTKHNSKKSIVVPDFKECNVVKKISTVYPPVCTSKFSHLNNNNKIVSSFNKNNKEFIIFDESVEKTISSSILDDALQYLTTSADSNYLLYTTTSGQVRVLNTETNEETTITQIENSKTLLMYKHEIVQPEYFMHVENTGKITYRHMTNEEEKDTVISWGSPSNNYESALLHKDGLLVAFFNGNMISMVNVTEPNNEPVTFECGREIPAEGPINSVKFSSNGYWMLVEAQNQVMAFDLRKEDRSTLAVQPLTFDTQDKIYWDIDHSGKILVALSLSETPELKIYNFIKSSKSWEQCLQSFQVSEIDSDSNIHGLTLLNGNINDSVTLLLQSDSESTLLSFI